MYLSGQRFLDFTKELEGDVDAILLYPLHALRPFGKSLYDSSQVLHDRLWHLEGKKAPHTVLPSRKSIASCRASVDV